ncbi:MAG: uncharacterized protein QOG04_1524 [Actinomycetota bacterium]|jgi:predicted enzyme related to lactoylglutathione lyase|nr:uncharacterized protein [Actinomycetota bacterium]
MGDPVIHFEFASKDSDKLKDFYSEAFDWKIDSNNPMNYGLVDTGGEGIPGGIGGIADPSYPGHLTIYVKVASIEKALAKVESLGGKKLWGPMEVPGGPTLGLFEDPAGHRVGLTEG